MGLKQKMKQAIVRHSVKKRKKTSSFDSFSSESFELSAGDASQNNSYYFSAHSADGVSLFLRLGKRGCGKREVWLAYYDEAGVAFVNTRLIYSEADCPVTLKCVKPLEEWQINFKGKVKRAALDATLVMQTYGEELEAVLEGTFICTEDLYEFSRDADEIPFARAVAAEKWSKEFFKELDSNTQVHTEQAGRLKCDLKIDGKTYSVNAPAMRDHSFGKREWNYMDRHIWLMSVSDQGNFNVNMVRYPALRGLRMGYSVCNGITENVIDATPLEKMPSTGGVPKNFSFSVKMKGGKVSENQCEISAAFPFKMGDGTYTIYEGIARFTVDGKKGRGIAEFGYNQDDTRWKD